MPEDHATQDESACPEMDSDAFDTRTASQPVLPVVSSLPPVSDLPHISRVLRLQKHQERQLRDLRAELHALQLATARSARLAKIAPSVHRTLAECIRSEDKPCFVSLFSTFHAAADGCARGTADRVTGSGCAPTSQDSFLDGLPDHYQGAIVGMLQQTRSSGDFIADRLATLTHREILSLLPDRASSRSTGSVLDSSSGVYSRAPRQLGYVADAQTELLSSLSFGSALETLVHSVHGFSRGSLCEDRRALDVWSTVCARLISDQKPGSEKVVPAVLDLWAVSTAWPGRQRFELWILQTLQRGAFLLEQPSKHSFRMRVQVRPDVPVQEDLQSEAFYAEAVGQLLDMLADRSGATVIPQPALRMFRAIWTKLPQDSGHQRGLSRFVLTRWLFSSFVPEATTLPEASIRVTTSCASSDLVKVFEMLPEHYVSDNARSRILREIASRAQKAVFEVTYAWRHGNFVPYETASRVEAIMDRLQDGGRGETSSPTSSVIGRSPPDREAFLVVSPADVTTMIRALYPQRRAEPCSSDNYLMQSGLQSSASSISGFSLFASPGPSELPSAIPTSRPPGVADGLSATTQGPSTSPLLNCRPSTAQPEVDAEIIREACNILEDTLDPSGTSTNNWSVLLLAPTHHGLLITPRASPAQQAGRPRSPLASYGEHKADACAALLEGFLLDDANLRVGNSGLDISSYDAGLLDVYLHFLRAVEDSYRAAEDAADFLQAHYWFKQLNHFRGTFANGLNLEPLRTMLEDIEAEAQTKLTFDEVSIDACAGWERLAMSALASQRAALATHQRTADQLRDKVWYVADVRTSAPYDEARSVANALRVMGKPKRASRSRIAPPLRHWSSLKLPAASPHLKTEAQVLELLSASPEQGGPNKLSDDQARATRDWIDRNNIEILCPAEERLHRLCMEVRKCVDQITAPDFSMLSSNSLFARDVPLANTRSGPLSALQATNGRLSQLQLRTNVAPSIDAVSSASHQLSSASSREYLESRSPTLTHKSSAPFWSPALTEARSPSSATSMGSYYTQTMPQGFAKQQHPRDIMASYRTIEELRQSVTGLLLSDLTSTLFSDGCETDRAFWTGLGGAIVEKHIGKRYGGLAGTHTASQDKALCETRTDSFDFMRAFERMLQSFAASSSPSVKLSLLYEIDQLLPLYVSEQTDESRRRHVEAKSIQLDATRGTSMSDRGADASIEGFRRLFCSTTLRPTAIFRDLQFIAALVPSATLESTPAGKAFCNAAVAVSSLKQELRGLMVETADVIIALDSNNRGHGRTSSVAQQQRDSATFSAPSRTPPAEDVTSYSMADAAYLLQITAKEDDPVAQRELATLYLTHPELMDHIVAPFARSKDVFKEELESKWRKNRDPNRCDPATMCVAHHWMSLSSKGGDALATEYLRQREEMERLP